MLAGNHRSVASSNHDWIQNLCNRLGSREQDAPGEDGPAQPHDCASPEGTDAVVLHDGGNGFHGGRGSGRLRSRLDGVKRLRRKRGDGASRSSVDKVRQGGLLDIPRLLKVLDDVVRAHAETGGRGLLERGACEPAVKADEAVFLQDDLDGVQSAVEALRTSRIVNQCGLDTFCRRHGCDTGEDTRGHASEHIPRRGQGSRLWILEPVLYRIKGKEANSIFAYAAND